MDEETEENLRQRFLEIEKKVSELVLNQYNKKEFYHLEIEIEEINSKLISMGFHIKEAQLVLEEANKLFNKYKGAITFCTFLSAITFGVLLFLIW